MRQLKISQSITSREIDSLEKYFTEIARIELITPEEEVMLAKKIKAGDENALNQLTKANLRFVVSVAKQFQGQGLSLSDLINEGNVGLIKAAKRFDETRGFKFISYAVWWIRQSIMMGIIEQARLVRVPLNKVGSYSKVNKLARRLEQEYEREPTLEELAALMNMKDSDLKDITYGSTKHVSMDAPMGDTDDTTMLDRMSDNGMGDLNPEREMFLSSLKEEIKRILSCLTEREAEILTCFFGLNGSASYNLEEIGKQFGLTRERVRQIKERTIRRLRKNTNSDILKPYLGQ